MLELSNNVKNLEKYEILFFLLELYLRNCSMCDSFSNCSVIF